MDPTSPSIPPADAQPLRRPFCVVAAIDMSEASSRVLRRAMLIANATPGSDVHVALVVDPPAVGLAPEAVLTVETSSDSLPQLTDFVNGEAKALAERIGTLQIGKITAHLLTGAPAREIVWLAAHVEADLIVLGTHGRTGVRRALLGSVAERVVRTAGCPVFVDRSKKHDPAAHAPEVEPMCPACAERRQATGGKELWCAHHQEHHVHGHIYAGPRVPTGANSSPFSFQD
ncbi:MAG: universal stress protein [Polyangiaceae bacterium]|nr:universal stress protein [Polyangiaceae bacterium]